MTHLLPLLLILFSAWYWWHAARVREVAVEAAARACEQCQVQFLDQTVSVQSWRLRRAASGDWCIWRRYGFEFSSDGQSRGQGFILMQSDQLQDMHLNLDVSQLPTRFH